MVSRGGSSERSKAPDKEHYTKAIHTARIDLTHSGARHGVGAHSGGQDFTHGTRSGAAWTSNLGQSSHCLNTCRRVQNEPVPFVAVNPAVARITQYSDFDPGHGDMECDLAGGERAWPSIMGVEYWRLEIVGLTSTHCLGSGTQLLERSWTLFLAAVRGSKLVWASLWLPNLAALCWSFLP